MKRLCLLALALPLWAQTPVPTINPDGVVRGDTTRAGILSPGIVISIWGHGYGPHAGCKGPATEVCGVQVLLDGTPIEVQYTNDVLVNARMPDGAAPKQVSQLVVVSGGQRSAPMDVHRLPETAVIALDGVARVEGPVWIHVELPRSLGVSYPSMSRIWDFACDGFEVRKDGKLLVPIAHPLLGMVYSGPMCPGSAFVGDANAHSRLPLHLQYSFEVPGTYEVRLSHYGDFGRRPEDIRVQSAWTPITVLPAVARTIGAHPQEPTAVMRDFLPDLLGRRNDEAFQVLTEYLYHASPRVRAYAADALYFWPDSVAVPRLLETLRANGPAPTVMQRLSSHASEIGLASLDYFYSDDPVLFQGAIAAARVVVAADDTIDPKVRSQMEDRLTGVAAAHLWRGDAQAAIDVISLLGQIHTQRAHNVLWELADQRQTGMEQALIAIAWHKDPKDLPRMAAYLIAEPAVGQSESALTGVPYSMRNSLGDAALPWLRNVLEKGQVASVRVHCAQELMRANDPAGFAFSADAFEHDRAWKSQIRSMVNDQFPETRNISEDELTKFLSERAR